MFALSAVLMLGLSTPTADPAPDKKTELAKWQGTWAVELQLSAGAEKPENERAIVKVVVKDDVWEVHFKDSDTPARGKMTLALDGPIKGLDLKLDDKTVFRSIYLLDGDRAVLRVGDANDERPKDFSTSTGSTSGGIMIYKRVKK
jgi:uncharacterized protein (TIGR03067 family)